ncbi:MAG: hypothetical protein ABI182_02225 [Candidatus Baltobacteraceae bacterium]
MIETAITLSFTLLLLLGTMQLALAGYFQMQLDAASFEYGHAYALGVTDPGGLNQISQLFPDVPVSQITFSASSPPVTNEPVNFTPNGQLTNRYGGASILRPQRLNTQAALNVSAFGFLSQNPIPFSASDVEGRYMISDHDDDAQGDPYDSQAVYNTQVNPISQDDQNVPPYYFNFAFLFHCDHPHPGWGPTCPPNQQNLHSLGLAEYLKDGNDTVDGNYDMTTMGVTKNDTFQAMAFHQRIYAQIAQVVFATPARPPYDWHLPNQFWDEHSNVTVPAGTASFGLIYSWDLFVPANAGNGIGRAHPLSPLNGCCD